MDRLLAALGTCLLAWALAQLAMGAEVVYVATNGSDQAAGEELNPVATVQGALGFATADSDLTIQVAPGVYEQEVSARRGVGKLTVRGAHHEREPKPEAHTILKGTLRVDRRPVTLLNLVLQGGKDSRKPQLTITNAPKVVLSNCAVRSEAPALWLSRCSKVRIENCTFVGHGNAVFIEGAEEVVFTGNTVVSSQFLDAAHGYTASWARMTNFCALTATDCKSLAVEGCTLQAPQRGGDALRLVRVATWRGDHNRYWGLLSLVADEERMARTIEDWRELTGQDAASRMLRLEFALDAAFGCRPDPRSPWGGTPNVTVAVPKDSVVAIGVFDLEGRQVRTLLTEYDTRDAAELKLHWDGTDNLRLPRAPVEHRLRVFQRDWTTAQSWIGNSGGSDDYIPFALHDLCLVPGKDLIVANSYRDEGGKEAMAYGLDGRPLHRFPDLHGSGRTGGCAAAATQDFVFLACEQGHTDRPGEDSPPIGKTWYCVRRYRPDGSFAPWEKGQGGNRTMLVVDTQPCIAGLAAQGKELFVSDTRANAIRVFDAHTMQQLRRFPFERPGRLAAEASGALWVARPAAEGQAARVLRCGRDGKPTTQIETLEAPAALALDEARGRLLVADNGPRQVLLYDITASPPKLASALGVPGGVHADPAGAAGDLRFNRITGVAADAQGNVYVGTSGLETSGVGGELRKLSPEGKLLWRRQGLTHVCGAAPDPESPEDVFTPCQRFRLDYTKQPPAWELAAWTLDPRKYDDPRSHGLYTSVLVRRIGGKRILYASDRQVSKLAIFRFDGEIAVPAGLLMPECRPKEWPPGQRLKGCWIWRDENGDGKIQPKEIVTSGKDEPRSWNWFVDAQGNIWRGLTRGWIVALPCNGLDAHGSPLYRWEDSRIAPMPWPFSGIHEFEFRSETETVYLTGESKDFSRDPADGAGPAGCLMARYDGNFQQRWLIPTETAITTRSFSAAGGMVFVTDMYGAAIQAYDADTGMKVGTVGPGKAVGYQSGWCDFPRCLRALRRPGGEYIVFNEEDWKAKVMLYRFRGGLREIGSQPVSPPAK